MAASLRILLIEDDPLVGRSIKRLLESRGHHVHLLDTLVSMTMREAAIRSRPQVVIADHQVGAQNGWFWAEAIFGEASLFPVRIIPMSGNPPSVSGTCFLKGSDPMILINMVESDS